MAQVIYFAQFKTKRIFFPYLFFHFLFLLASCYSISAQGPAGYTLCCNEGESFTLTARSHVAYGANGSFAYLYNQTGSITFNNSTFGDPAPGVVKSGYYKIAIKEGNINILSRNFNRLKDHITGFTILNGQTLNTISDSIQQNIFALIDTSFIIKQAFDIIDCYENIKGPIFKNSSTKNGFNNDFKALDGNELARAVFIVQQGVFDQVYNAEYTTKYSSLISGKKYKTSDYFPGLCPKPVDSLLDYKVKINANLPPEYGTGTAFSSSPARRPTGYYLSPGSIGTVKVPAAIVGKGFNILVGANTVNRSSHSPVQRFFRVTNTFPIEDSIIKIANPFGGGIYIIVPYKSTEGIIEISLTNVVPAPFFSFKSWDKTSLTDWKEKQRKNQAPWSDFESEKYLMQVPTSWIYNYDDPESLMKDWDKRIDVVSKLTGYPLSPNNIKLYLQVDVGIQYNGFYGIGNPQVNNTYNPTDIENGNKNHWFLKPGVNFWETEFHEMGHAQLFSKFPGETEAIVNLLAAAIYNRLYGVNIDESLGRSFGNLPYITRDQAALNWMVTPNFRAGNPMDISNTTKDEVRYQQRGYAKYVEMAALFGWESIDSFYKKEQLDYINKVTGDGLSSVDSRILRFSKTTGVDVRPLVHFWGIQPQNQSSLIAELNAKNLKPSKKICERLQHYKSIIPLNNAEFRVHANAFFGGSVPSGGDPDYGSGWYNIWVPIYNESHGALAQKSMQNIIDLYFPNGCPVDSTIPVISSNNQNICQGQSVTLTATGATYYQWSTGETGSSITVNPTISTTYTVIGKTAGYNSLPISVTVTVNPIPNVTVNNDSICLGDSAILIANGAVSYEWSNGANSKSIIVKPTTNTTYSVTGTLNGCTSKSEESKVIVSPLPIIHISQINQGQSTKLDASGSGTKYFWSTGESTPSIEVNKIGTYTVTVTNDAGCSANSSIVVKILSSDKDVIDLINVVVKPNPTADIMQIECTGSLIKSIQMMDNLGHLIIRDQHIVPIGSVKKLDIEALPSGSYFLQVDLNEIIKMIHIIKI